MRVRQVKIGRVAPDRVDQKQISGFGGDGGIGDLGRSISGLGENIKQEQIKADENIAEEARLNYDRDITTINHDPDNGYFNLSGKSAVDGRKDAEEAIGIARQNHAKNLTPEQAKMFNRIADKMEANSRKSIMVHSAGQQKVWEVATQEASIENSFEQGRLNYLNDEQIAIQHATMRNSVKQSSDDQGIGSQATNERLQTMTSKYYASIIGRALDDDTPRAKELFERTKKYLEPAELSAVKKALKGVDTKESAMNTADDWMDAGYSVEEGMDKARKITDPDIREATENRFRHLKGIETQETKRVQYDTAERVIGDLQDGMIKSDISPNDWENMSTSQREVVERMEEKRLADIETDNKIFEIAQSDSYDDMVAGYHSAIREGDLTFEDMPEAFRRSLTQADYTALTKTQGTKASPYSGDYDKATYQTINNLLASGRTKDAYEHMINNADKLGKKYSYMSNQITSAMKDSRKEKVIKTLSTYRQRISYMFNNDKQGKKVSSWVNEEFESYYETFQAENNGRVPTLTEAKQEISNLYARTKEAGTFYGQNEIKTREEYKEGVQKYRDIKATRLSMMRTASDNTGLPVSVIRNQVGQESNFDPNAKSYTGVRGMHQITTATAKAHGFDPKRVRSNKPEDEAYQWDAYTAIMKANMKDMGNSVKWALVAYNAGTANANLMKAGKEPKAIRWTDRSGKKRIKTSKQVKKEAYNYLKQILGDK